MNTLNLPYKINAGWILGTEHTPSPNCSDRPQNSIVNLLIVHNISLPPGEYGNGCIADFFTNQLNVCQHPYFESIACMRVSAHILIERTGRVCQFVSLASRAWHAGASSFAGVEDCNNYSIGIELEGTDSEPYTSVQYRELTDLCQAIMLAYPGITADRIVGHFEVAPGRKTDPGESFDWLRLKNSLR